MSQPDADKSESDVESDPKVASSRANKGDDEYVGRASGDEDFDTEESGAEARSDDS